MIIVIIVILLCLARFDAYTLTWDTTHALMLDKCNIKAFNSMCQISSWNWRICDKKYNMHIFFVVIDAGSFYFCSMLNNTIRGVSQKEIGRSIFCLDLFMDWRLAFFIILVVKKYKIDVFSTFKKHLKNKNKWQMFPDWS